MPCLQRCGQLYFRMFSDSAKAKNDYSVAASSLKDGAT